MDYPGFSRISVLITERGRKESQTRRSFDRSHSVPQPGSKEYGKSAGDGKALLEPLEGIKFTNNLILAL